VSPRPRVDPDDRSAWPRRGLLRWLGAGLGYGCAGAAGLLPLTVHANGQVEEDLADSVRTALSAAVAFAAPPKPVFSSEAERLRFSQWLAHMDERLARRMPQARVREDFLHTVWYESRRAGLETALVLGLIEVESGFRKFAISSASARGYMQVMPFWVRSIGDGDEGKLFHAQTNIRFGCVILRYYLDRERGDLFMALGRYNGSRGRAPYPQAVLAARQRWHVELPGTQALS